MISLDILRTPSSRNEAHAEHDGLAQRAKSPGGQAVLAVIASLTHASSVSTVSGRILLLASRSLSSDLVEQVLRAIAAHMPGLIARHPSAADINVKRKPTLDDGLSIDLHPGAERFFQSVSTQ